MSRMQDSNGHLSGFNNLTKVLSFNLYDFCITLDEKQRSEYVQWIHQKYNAQKIYEISKEICQIMEANILNTSLQDYDPVGASTLVLMSDLKGGGDQWAEKDLSGPNTTTMNLHLDKSHITAHTYPDAEDKNGICSFRVDIDIATCGEIIPLNAINVLFEAFECDLVLIDYVVRGYTRLKDGSKIFNDQKFNSIQDFIKTNILEMYEERSDRNMNLVNTWQTKLKIKDFSAKRYLMDSSQIGHPDVQKKMEILAREMGEVYQHMG